jgi:hypothetical protein
MSGAVKRSTSQWRRAVGCGGPRGWRRAGGSVYELVLKRSWMRKRALDDALSLENMGSPRRVAAAEPKLG